ncbi:MAG: histidine triad nucleotide-binding protein [Gemmatimonadetes bacterium]|nr:MAG: histidine triad nucleotide-binding protein [Gemmatimonadota bacterium]
MNDCIFCKIVRNEIPSTIVYEDDRVLVFEDINPRAPVHVLVIPKDHIASMNEVNAANADLLGYMMSVIPQIAAQKGIAESGYRVITNTGAEGGQIVHHLHFHLLGGRQLKGLG